MRQPRPWKPRSRPSTTCARRPTTGGRWRVASCIASSGTPEAGDLKIPTRADVTVFASPAAFRAWLESNHDTASEVFVGYYRKGVPKTAMTYPESVEEALCFGWIDGITRRIDDEVTSTRFTPRRPTSNWSAINIARIAQLTAAGRMHPAGLHAFETRDRRNDGAYSYERPPLELPPAWLAQLEATPHWLAETPSFRRQAAHWVMSAKRDATGERRFATLLADSAAGRRPKPFIVERSNAR